jgi:hypothetical protein
LCSFWPLSFAGNGSSIGLHGSIGVAHAGYLLAVLHPQKKPRLQCLTGSVETSINLVRRIVKRRASPQRFGQSGGETALKAKVRFS